MSIIANPAIVDPGSLIKPSLGVVRYTAPEVLVPSKFGLANSIPSKGSDVYSLAMTAYEVRSSHCTLSSLTLLLPYRSSRRSHLTGDSRDSMIILYIVAGNRPPRPTDTHWLQDHIWNMITTCWSEKQEQRLGIRVMYNQLLASSIQEMGQGNQCATKIVT